MPISGNDSEMEKLGWVKSLIYETIMCNENTQGRPILTERDFYAENQRCGTCKSNEYVWLLVHDFDYRGGVFAGCSRCRRTWGVLGEQEVSSEKTVEVTTKRYRYMHAILMNRPDAFRVDAERIVDFDFSQLEPILNKYDKTVDHRAAAEVISPERFTRRA